MMCGDHGDICRYINWSLPNYLNNKYSIGPMNIHSIIGQTPDLIMKLFMVRTAFEIPKSVWTIRKLKDIFQ